MNTLANIPTKVHLTPAGAPGTWQHALVTFIFYGPLPSDQRDELGAIVLAMLKNNRNHFPRYAYAAHIDKDGNVFADFASGPLEKHRVARRFIDHVDNLNGAMRKLADVLKFSDKDRIEMFDTLRSWIATDARALEHIEDEIPGYKKPEVQS